MSLKSAKQIRALCVFMALLFIAGPIFLGLSYQLWVSVPIWCWNVFLFTRMIKRYQHEDWLANRSRAINVDD